MKKNMNTTTIILLCAPRCGSTVVYEVFKNHPDVHALLEPQFWNSAAEALEGNSAKFTKILVRNFSFLEIPPAFTEKTVFELWNGIHKKYGSVLFDKTSFYLGDRKALKLIKKYRDAGNNVRFIGLIRDPRDAITSQYELWGSSMAKGSMKRAEERWLDRYKHLEELQNEFGTIPVFRYEDIADFPHTYIPHMLRHCTLKKYPGLCDMVKPAAFGRYAGSLNFDVRRWKMSYALKMHFIKYGYSNIQKKSMLSTAVTFLRVLPDSIGREIARIIKIRRRIKKRKRIGLP